jgi:cobalamin biosynthetic protein CobC
MKPGSSQNNSLSNSSLSNSFQKNDPLPLHGGDIVSASRQYEISIDQWIDLSTGINPRHYPIEIDTSSFQQLPYVRPEFIEASKSYYQSSNFIPVTGTQAAIQHLPELLMDFPVLIPQIGYQEHANYWQHKGAAIHYYPSLEKQEQIDFIDNTLSENPQQHLVVINPNNPTGVLLAKQKLLSWAQQLAPQAYLIIDEAFIDTTVEQSVLDQNLPDNIIVLRSFGKFFGLAGIRLGYCFANENILSALQARLGLWQINGPAQTLAIKALHDKAWQLQAKKDIKSNAKFMQKLCKPVMCHLNHHSQSEYHSCLFLSYRMPYLYAMTLREHFARLGILLRVIEIDENINDKQALLRIGLLDECNQTHVKRVFAAFNSAAQSFSDTNVSL